MEAVIAVFALLFVLFVALGTYAAVKAVGAAKRGVDRTITQARRTVEDHTLRAKSFGMPGPAGEIAQLRLKLRTSMRATQDALHAGVAEDESLKESLGLFERLSVHGHELDDELKRLESEPDRATLAERLPQLRERTERIVHSADSLRWAARDRARHLADDDFDALSAQIDVETGALRHWTATEPAPGRVSWPEPGGSEEGGFEAGDGSVSGTARGGPASRAAGDGSASHAAGEPARPAITPPTARQAYPWQKRPRPESTT